MGKNQGIFCKQKHTHKKWLKEETRTKWVKEKTNCGNQSSDMGVLWEHAVNVSWCVADVCVRVG